MLKAPPSVVRVYTLIGALLGVTFGYWIPIWISDYWPLVVGGKPIASWVPYTIIGFEVMVLIGSLSTVFGMFVTRAHSRASRRPWATIRDSATEASESGSSAGPTSRRRSGECCARTVRRRCAVIARTLNRPSMMLRRAARCSAHARGSRTSSDQPRIEPWEAIAANDTMPFRGQSAALRRVLGADHGTAPGYACPNGSMTPVQARSIRVSTNVEPESDRLARVAG